MQEPGRTSGIAAWARAATSDGTPKRALAVALVVGTILNIINQGDVLLAGGAAALNWPKVCLTFLVPYLVATYGAVTAKLAYARAAARR